MVWPFSKKPKSGPPLNYVTAAEWAAPFGSQFVSPQAAENLAAVLGAVNAIAQTIGALPAYVVRSNDPAAEPVDTHPLARLIATGPNANQTWSDYVEWLLAQTLLRGNGLSEILTDKSGRLSGLRPLPWQFVMPWVNDAGVLRFDYTPTLPPDAGQRQTFLREDVLFVADRSDNGVIGVSRLRRAAGALTNALETQSAATTFALNSARPSGVLEAPGKVSDETAKRLRSDWATNFGGSKKGGTAVLSEGLTWKSLSQFSAEDLQIINSRNFSVADVARVFGVPPFVLADPSRSTYASAREATRYFGMTSIAPWATRLERAFSASVLSPEFKLVFDLNSLTRADPEQRWASWERARRAGVLSPNDVRVEEGWPKVPDGDGISPPNTSANAAADPADPADTSPPAAPGGKDTPLLN